MQLLGTFYGFCRQAFADGGFVFDAVGDGDGDVDGGGGVAFGATGGIDREEGGVGGNEAEFHGEGFDLLGERAVFFPDGALAQVGNLGASPERGKRGAGGGGGDLDRDSKGFFFAASAAADGDGGIG